MPAKHVLKRGEWELKHRKDLARLIVDCLFTSAVGKADRLVLVDDLNRDLGGWMQSAAEKQVINILEKWDK